MAQEVLISLSIIIGIATLLTILARAIKQPPIISYLIAGVIAGPLFLKLIGHQSTTSEFVQIFAHIGVALLLFIVGLSLDFRVLKNLGGVSALAGLGEIMVVTALGFVITLALGFTYTPALYIAVALAFSSTVIVVKLLSDKKEMDTLHAQIALGILIVQDFVAAIVLMIIPTLKTGATNTIFMNLSYIVALIAVIFLFSSLILKRFMGYLAKNQEVLFLFGIAWALVLASLFDFLGFSLEIGALIAGISLSSSIYTFELGGKMKPLRDFFIVLFFVFFGSQLATTLTLPLLRNALILSAFVLLAKPLIVMGIMKTLGYKKRTNFLTGSSLAQISEFSLILILLGYTLGHLSQEIMSLAVLVSLITIGISSYSIFYSHTIFEKLSNLLGIFEGRGIKHYQSKNHGGYDAILFGYNRTGYDILKLLKKTSKNFVVIDYNPQVILKLSKQGINCIYGDAKDKEFIEELQLHKTKMVVSTIPDLESNLLIKERLSHAKSNAIFIATVLEIREAMELYHHKVDYVMIPPILGGEYLSKMIKHNKTNKAYYRKKARNEIRELRKRL